MTSPPAVGSESPASVLPDPPSLRRRAPARLDITLKSGYCPQISRRRIHLRAGQTLVVQVIPPGAAKVEIIAESPVAAVVPANRVEGSGGPSYHGEYTGRSPLRVIPLPITGRLHISVLDGQPNPFRVTIPVTVWPSVSTLALWWLIAALSILGARWQKTLASSDSVFAIFPVLRADLPYLVELILLGALVVIPLRIIGWLMTLSRPSDE